MSEKNMQNIVKEYLKNVKSKLPEWLKEKKEHNEILAELEDHIWSKAEELSETGQATLNSVQIAITHMGTPESIAKEYKRRGTPKVYITEELWPSYVRVLGIVFAVIVGISIVSQVIELIFGNIDFWDIFWNIIQGMWTAGLVSFALITIIFVALSLEGYFPEDFKSQKIRDKEREQIEKSRKEGIPISEIKKKPVKPYIKPIGEIIGGVLGIIFGIFLVLQPISAVFSPSLIDQEFLLFLQFAGIFILIEGILDLNRGLIGNRQMIAHQVLHIILIGVKLSSISVVILMMNRPEIFPILIVGEPGDALINIGIAPEYYAIFRAIAGLLIAIVALSTIEDFYRIYKAEKYKN
jgi:hypothetical protein